MSVEPRPTPDAVTPRERAPTHPEDIKAAIRKKGKTLTQLALDHGKYENLCRIAIRGYGAPEGELIIAQFLGYRPMDLFPSRYDANGVRIDPRLRIHRSARPDAGHRQNGAGK